jgi:hypothetical protein
VRTYSFGNCRDMIRPAAWVAQPVSSWLRQMPEGTEVDAEWVLDGEGKQIGIIIRVIEEMDLKIHHYNEKA